MGDLWGPTASHVDAFRTTSNSDLSDSGPSMVEARKKEKNTLPPCRNRVLSEGSLAAWRGGRGGPCRPPHHQPLAESGDGDDGVWAFGTIRLSTS